MATISETIRRLEDLKDIVGDVQVGVGSCMDEDEFVMARFETQNVTPVRIDDVQVWKSFDEHNTTTIVVAY